MSKKKVLIIGGTGFIGYHLAKKTYKKFDVTSISLNKPKKKEKLKYVKYLIADISKKKFFQSKIKKDFDIIVNLGGYINHKDKNLALNTHYKGCKNLVNFFKNKKIKIFIQIGSSSEYGTQKSPNIEKIGGNAKTIYAKSKLKATKLLMKLFKTSKSFPFVVLRLYQVYGPYQNYNRLIPMVVQNSLTNKRFACSGGAQTKDFIYVNDAVDAIYKCFNNKKIFGQIINIGTGKPMKIKNLILKIVKKIGLGKPIFGVLKMRSDEPKNSYPSIKKAKKLLLWKPKTNFDEGLNKTIKYYKNEKNQL